MRDLFVLGVVLVLAAAAKGDIWSSEPPEGRAVIQRDFMAEFDPARVQNALGASASLSERSGETVRPGVFLHPQGADDAVLTYAAVPIDNSFLVFWLGFRDGIPWDSADAPPNGVRFSVNVDGQPVFAEECRGAGWRGRAVDLRPWSGKTVTLEFRTNAIDGNSSYDWAVFGEPMLVSLPGGQAAPQPAPEAAPGLALVLVSCAQPSEVTLEAGETAESAQLGAGDHWLPLAFKQFDAVRLTVAKGAAQVSQTLAAPYAASLTRPVLSLSTPLVTKGRPFTLLFETTNRGKGVYDTPAAIELKSRTGEPVLQLGNAAGQPRQLERAAPGETVTLRWDGLVASTRGDITIQAGPSELTFHVFDTEPRGEPSLYRGAMATASPGEPITGKAENGFSRLSFVSEQDGYAYAVGEIWERGRWKRVASLYPLAAARIAKESPGGGGPEPRDLAFRFRSVDKQQTALFVHGAMVGDDAEWPVLLVFQAEAKAPRFTVTAQLTSPDHANLLSFYAPVVLAGDRASGERKDFGLFPGLEYLEGNEPSSSDRDLAFPLSDRRVPAPHKITVPLMAAQSDGALVALLWDMNQEWGAGEKHPAAAFLAPRFGSGREYIEMALFAPSVGPYVSENAYHATDKPYPMKPGQAVTLDACLVLDNRARYPVESVVQGPHRGGLVVQAVRHWFDVYGFPEPSPQPRDWDAERALCRDAYLHAVWSEDPPGWSHCHGWKPGPFVGHVTPLLLDLQAGVDEPDRTEVLRRIDAVLERFIAEQGPQSLWSNAGCHILLGELPFYRGGLAEALTGLCGHARELLAARKDGLWVWQPSGEKQATLGDPGGHTLGQAALPSFVALRAARMSGDADLAQEALDAMKQMELYETPRGAQTWECPLYEPDILAAAYAVRACCEAFRLTGDADYIAHARYWAWTGLPFLYAWNLDGRPAMRYNVISVMGSTFHTHSWLGLPVVWCGLVYAYALQELAESDASFDWRRVAQGISNSAMWQQYTEGPSKGTYPDSWNLLTNTPNPADINPENILMNEFRLRGRSPEIRSVRFTQDGNRAFLNTPADIVSMKVDERNGTLIVGLLGAAGAADYGVMAPVAEPQSITGAGARVRELSALEKTLRGWMYVPEMKAVVFKLSHAGQAILLEVRWP